MLEVSAINQYYDQSHILWDLDLTVEEGLCTCLMGRNGVGKTTLLKVIMGLLPIRSGSIRFMGEELAGKPVEYRAQVGIGYVPQGRMIFPQLTVKENLLLPLNGRKGRRDIPQQIFALFPVLQEMMHRRGGDLSGGQQQQLAIGRALVLEPKLLILDEPAEGIQPNIVKMIGEVIRELNRHQGISVLLVEQKLAFARNTADRFCIIERGANVDPKLTDQLSDALVRKHLAV